MNGTPVAELLPEQIRFRVEGSGAYSGRELVPETAAAAQLLRSDAGGRAQDALTGLLSLLDERGQRADLRGISLATSPQGYLANGIATSLEGGYIPPPESAPDGAAQRQADSVAGKLRGAAASYFFGWIDVGAEYSAYLLEQFAAPSNTPTSRGRGTRVAQTMRHELEHAVTPWKDDHPGTSSWLDEAIAETLSNWAGEPAASARAMGLPHDSRFQFHTYRRPVSVVTGLLHDAGIDTRSTSGHRQAEDLLQSHDLRYVPGRLARAIIDHAGLPADTYEPLRRAIRDLNGSPERLKALRERFLDGGG